MNDTAIESRAAAARRIVADQTELLHRSFGRAETTLKEDGSPVTVSDLEISRRVFAALHQAFPEDELFSEEMDSGGPHLLRSRFAWVLDPIDGTNNFAVGLPICAISLGLLEEGRPVYGVIYDFARRQLMHGGPGRGFFDGDQRAQVRSDPPNGLTLIGVHTPSEKGVAPQVDRVIRHFKMRGLGSGTLHLAYVAAGILDGCLDHNVKVWDIAAAYALCLEAGVEVEFLNGDVFPLREFDTAMPRIHYLAGNPAVCRRLREVIRE